jgi:hypothetical protein
MTAAGTAGCSMARACRGNADGVTGASAVGRSTMLLMHQQPDVRPPLAFLLDDAGPVEQQARLRELRVLAALILNWGHPVVAELETAISDPVAVDQAMTALACAPSRGRRRILASFGALHGVVRIRVSKTLDADDGRCPRCGGPKRP